MTDTTKPHSAVEDAIFVVRCLKASFEEVLGEQYGGLPEQAQQEYDRFKRMQDLATDLVDYIYHIDICQKLGRDLYLPSEWDEIRTKASRLQVAIQENKGLALGLLPTS